MEEPQLFVTESEPYHICDGLNNNYESSQDTIIGSLRDRASVDQQQQLEVELSMNEKALYLCSELGLFLVQEINSLLSEKKNLVNDHTKVLLDLQSYESMRKSFLDLAETDGNSEFNDALSMLAPDDSAEELQLFRNRFQSNNSTNALDSMDKLVHLQNQMDDMHQNPGVYGGLKRAGSLDSLTELQSIPESTLTSYSNVTKNLQSDLDKLQRAHERITRLEVQLDSTSDLYELNALYSCSGHKSKPTVTLPTVTLSTVTLPTTTLPTTTLPVPPKWSEWMNWSNCDVTCGKGKKNRFRKCQDKSGANAAGCVGSATEQVDCDSSPCPSIWGEWTTYRPCSRTCGVGYQYRTRKCLGSQCPGRDISAKRCIRESCRRDAMWGSKLRGRGD